MVRGRILGDEHPLTLTSASNLAQSLSSLGRYADARQVFVLATTELHFALVRKMRARQPAGDDTQPNGKQKKRRASGDESIGAD